jgi:hypothetical protein
VVARKPVSNEELLDGTFEQFRTLSPHQNYRLIDLNAKNKTEEDIDIFNEYKESKQFIDKAFWEFLC